jgi:hypothetical protein
VGVRRILYAVSLGAQLADWGVVLHSGTGNDAFVRFRLHGVRAAGWGCELSSHCLDCEGLIGVVQQLPCPCPIHDALLLCFCVHGDSWMFWSCRCG